MRSSYTQKQYVLTHLGVMLHAHIPIYEALCAIKKEITYRPLQKKITQIITAIDNGAPLHEALTNSHLFPQEIIHLIQQGEESDQLTEHLSLLLLQEEKKTDLKQKLSSAMIYPCLVMMLIIILGIGISWFILPQFARMFSQMNTSVPPITKAAINVGLFFQQYGNVVIPSVLFILSLFFYLFFIYTKTRRIGDHILFHIPLLRRFLLELELTRMGHIFGHLLQTGLPIDQILSTMKETTKFFQYKRFYQTLEKDILNGKSFEQSIKQYPHIRQIMPTYVQQMIYTGEQTGELPNMFLEISRIQDKKIEQTTKQLHAVFEPLLLIIVAIAIFLLALAVVLPIYNIFDTI